VAVKMCMILMAGAMVELAVAMVEMTPCGWVYVCLCVYLHVIERESANFTDDSMLFAADRLLACALGMCVCLCILIYILTYARTRTRTHTHTYIQHPPSHHSHAHHIHSSLHYLIRAKKMRVKR